VTQPRRQRLKIALVLLALVWLGATAYLAVAGPAVGAVATAVLLASCLYGLFAMRSG
jgi:hypothetical protein